MTATTPDLTPELSPTTGEPVAVVARRNRMGIWLCIVSDAAGTVSLLIAYIYLWSLNVNNAWAPRKDHWAEDRLFWIIVALMIVACGLLWWGVAGIREGRRGRLIAAGTIASLILLGTFILQIVQLSTFPFDITEGAYASATFWLAISNAIHLSLGSLLVLAVGLRTRAGRINQGNPSQAGLVAMWITWLCVAATLGAIVTTTMKHSPNVTPPEFQSFQTSSTS
jgi:heme/copper-type cytochrome/quinol oxidase subunit 3